MLPSLVPPTDQERAAELRRLLLRVLAGVLGIFSLVFLAARVFRDPLRVLGESFVERFGLLGIFFGTLFTDVFSFPIPPQFYLLTIVTNNREQLIPVLTVILASLIAGATDYLLARHLIYFQTLQRFLERTREGIEQIFRRWGPWALVIASITPIPYSLVCYTVGFYRMPWRLFLIFLLLRAPRLLVYYAVLRAGWSL